MSRDVKVRARTILVIPGTILMALSLAMMLYGLVLRGDNNICQSGAHFALAGACYHVAQLFLAPLVLGAVLLLVGVFRFKANPADVTDPLAAGTPTFTILGLLITMASLPALAWIIIKVLEARGEPRYTATFGDTVFLMSFVLEMVFLLALLALIPALAIHLGANRRRKLAVPMQFEFEDEIPEEDEEEPVYDAPEPTKSPGLAERVAGASTSESVWEDLEIIRQRRQDEEE